jgi:hemerythrin superfamily protein
LRGRGVRIASRLLGELLFQGFARERDKSEQVGNLVDRLDVTIEKLTEVSTTVSQLLAVQGNRLDFQEKVAAKLEDLIEKRRVETETMIKDLHKKIEDGQKTSSDQHASMNKDIVDRIGKIEKFVWLSLGGGTVIGFILSTFPWENLFQ